MSLMPRAGVIGHPISHSLSPKLHGHWLATYDLVGEYTAFDVPEDQLGTKIRSFQAEGFRGINVTLPHKVEILKHVDQISDRATLIGAANTITFMDDGRILADNTDGYGFISNLRQGAPDWDPTAGPAAIFGAGGAARAIIVALADAGVSDIFLANRTRPKADALRADFGPRIHVVDWVRADTMLTDAVTVINTTSLGMKGAQPFKVSLDQLRPDAVVTDIVYNPLQTPFLQQAAAKGCHTVDGLGMLLHQGVPGFERWFGVRPEVTQNTRKAVLG